MVAPDRSCECQQHRKRSSFESRELGTALLLRPTEGGHRVLLGAECSVLLYTIEHVYKVTLREGGDLTTAEGFASKRSPRFFSTTEVCC